MARDLGINVETLRLWLKQADIDRVPSGYAGQRAGLSTDERAELARPPATVSSKGRAQLRRENAVLKEEREILKKAARFFAAESATR